MSINNLVAELKENDQDFEFYPTTDEMLKVVVNDYAENVKNSYRFDNKKGFLDIGAGTCKLYYHLSDKELLDMPYYAIEKSKILIGRFPASVSVLGTDFYTTTLIDKPAKVYFCNPPYSEYVEWTEKILKTGNFNVAYLIIPERWKNQKELLAVIEGAKIRYEIIGNFDFLNGERQARAKVDIVRFEADLDNRNTAFDRWFEETFEVDTNKPKVWSHEKEEKKMNELNALVVGENKAESLVNSYNQDMAKLCNVYKTLCSIDEEILEEVGVNYSAVKESLRNKIENLKTLYWRCVFDCLDEITCRLTKGSRDALFDKFSKHNTVDFNLDNIQVLVIWVIKNANQYYDKQLVNFYYRLVEKENIKPYKSNQKLFDKDGWRYNVLDKKNFVLDYRIVVPSLFKSRMNYDGHFDKGNKDGNIDLLKDIQAIARNLGFETGFFDVPSDYGEKCYFYLSDQKTPLMEYKIYRNGNTHIKLNIEFTKAFNVEVSRLLGWIRNKDDIAKEFPDELAKGAEKYFNSNINMRLTTNNVKLLK